MNMILRKIHYYSLTNLRVRNRYLYEYDINVLRNRMLADVVFYGNRKSDVTCLKRKLRPYLLVYIIEK
jgi:hypothetical protein